MKSVFFVCCMIALVAFPGGAVAFDHGKFQVNGFASQGYLETSDNGFLDPNSEDGSFEINEIGLTVNSQLTERFRLGGQLLSRDLGDDGNNNLRIDWALGDYRFADWFGVQAGKIKMPIGLYNETRDSDFLRPIVDTINAYLEPLRPVIDLLDRELKVISWGPFLTFFDQNDDGKVTLLDLAVTFGQVSPTAQSFIDAAIFIIELVEDLNGPGLPGRESNLTISLGDFDFGSIDLRHQDFASLDPSGGVFFDPDMSVDDAFAALPDGTVEALLEDPQGDLTNILLYHVVEGAVPAETVVNLDSALTLQGSDVAISVNDDGVILNDSVKVILTDIVASNGIIHVIDGILLPSAEQANATQTLVQIQAKQSHTSCGDGENA